MRTQKKLTIPFAVLFSVILKTSKENNVQGKKDFLEISNNKIISSSDGRVKKEKSNDVVFILSFLVMMVVAIALGMAFWNMMNDNKDDEQTQVTQSENFVEPEQNQEDRQCRYSG